MPLRNSLVKNTPLKHPHGKPIKNKQLLSEIKRGLNSKAQPFKILILTYHPFEQADIYLENEELSARMSERYLRVPQQLHSQDKYREPRVFYGA